MTTEYPAPAEANPYSFGDAVALIVATADDEKLPFPRGLRDNRPGTQLLVLDFTTLTDAHAWAEFFGIVKWGAAEVGYVFGWHGWTVTMWVDKPADPAESSGSGGIELSSPSPDSDANVCAIASDPPLYNAGKCRGPLAWELIISHHADDAVVGIARRIQPVCYQHAYNEVRWRMLHTAMQPAKMSPLPRHSSEGVPAEATS